MFSSIKSMSRAFLITSFVLAVSIFFIASDYQNQAKNYAQQSKSATQLFNHSNALLSDLYQLELRYQLFLQKPNIQTHKKLNDAVAVGEERLQELLALTPMISTNFTVLIDRVLTAAEFQLNTYRQRTALINFSQNKTKQTELLQQNVQEFVDLKLLVSELNQKLNTQQTEMTMAHQTSETLFQSVLITIAGMLLLVGIAFARELNKKLRQPI